MEKKRKILPPVYLFAALILIWLMQRFFPIYQYVDPPLAYLGIVPVLFGIIMAAISSGAFVKAGTGIVPFDKATMLVTDGFYRVTRNPMYTGMIMMLLGVAVLTGAIGALLPIPAFFMIIRNNFVLGEERFLETTFGMQYTDYKSTVRRWI